MSKKLLTSTILLSSIILFSTFLLPKNDAVAQEGAVSSFIAVPISTGQDLQSIMNYRKNFGLDLIATSIAKRILHTMSLDIVDWINSGFDGNPAFISNPSGFFLDAVDQVSGQFIFEGGLAGLCSPFEIDIKAALYMGQAGYDTRYACTLGQIIDNTRNIGDNFYVNGSSINGFMGGDFTQGGWPAFISMTTQPQNNPTGAYLKAKSELSATVAARKAAINVDLDRGNGFLSWSECKDNPLVQQYAPTQAPIYTNNDNFSYFGSTSSITSQFGQTVTENKVTQTCETKTPGSVIAGSVNKSLGAGQDELVAADDINSIINALISTLARTVLTGGLKTISGGGTGSGGNYSSTRYREMIEADYKKNTDYAIAKSQTDNTDQVNSITEIKSYYDKSVDLVGASKTKYLDAKLCFNNKLASNYSSFDRNNIQNSINLINYRITKEVDPLLLSLMKKQSTANSLYQTSLNTNEPVDDTKNLNAIQEQAETSATQYVALSSINQTTVNTAITDWQNATNKSTGYTNEAQNMLANCNNYR